MDCNAAMLPRGAESIDFEGRNEGKFDRAYALFKLRQPNDVSTYGTSRGIAVVVSHGELSVVLGAVRCKSAKTAATRCIAWLDVDERTLRLARTPGDWPGRSVRESGLIMGVVCA